MMQEIKGAYLMMSQPPSSSTPKLELCVPKAEWETSILSDMGQSLSYGLSFHDRITLEPANPKAVTRSGKGVQWLGPRWHKTQQTMYRLRMSANKLRIKPYRKPKQSIRVPVTLVCDTETNRVEIHPSRVTLNQSFDRLLQNSQSTRRSRLVVPTPPKAEVVHMGNVGGSAAQSNTGVAAATPVHRPGETATAIEMAQAMVRIQEASRFLVDNGVSIYVHESGMVDFK